MSKKRSPRIPFDEPRRAPQRVRGNLEKVRYRPYSAIDKELDRKFDKLKKEKK